MELLRGQLAALTEEVRRSWRYHPRNDDEPVEDAETDSHNNFSNPIGQPRRGVPRQVPSLQRENQNGNLTSRLSYLSSMVAKIMKNSWIDLTKWKESLISIR